MTALLALAALVGGLHGVVLRGPVAPVCRVGEPCDAPAAGATLVFRQGGAVAARVHAGAGGRYAVRLPPGLYAVAVTPAPRIGSGLRPAAARVRGGVDARLDFHLDTGIR
jgi:hypothetical protein